MNNGHEMKDGVVRGNEEKENEGWEREVGEGDCNSRKRDRELEYEKFG